MKTGVMKIRAMKTTGIFLLMILLALPCFSEGEENIESLVRMVKERAVPLTTIDPASGGDDLEFLRDVVGNASIVCLGESQHIMREQYQLKHRIIKYLVERMNFTHIAIEDSLYGTIAVDDYIKGAAISPEDALKRTGGWYMWDTEEMLSFVRWLRTHNDGVKENRQKVSYVGIDIQDPWPGIVLLRNYFQHVDPEYADLSNARRQVFDIFNKPFWVPIKYGYSKLDAPQKRLIEETLNEARERLETHRQTYIKEGGAKMYRDMVLVVDHLLKSHRYFMELEKDDDGGGGFREETMFADIKRIRETAGPDARIIVWVHNAHASKSPVSFLKTGTPESVQLNLLGTMLKGMYGNEIKSLGIASLGVMKKGGDFKEQPDILDHVLSMTGQDLFFLDLAGRMIRDGGDDLLKHPWKLTADMGGFLSLVPAEAYDGLFFIKYVTGVKRSPTSEKRFQSLF